MSRNPSIEAVQEALLMNQALQFYRMATAHKLYTRGALNLAGAIAEFRNECPERAAESPFIYYTSQFHPDFNKNIATLAAGISSGKPESEFDELFNELFLGQKSVYVILGVLHSNKEQLVTSGKISAELVKHYDFDASLNTEHDQRVSSGKGCGDGTESPCSGITKGSCGGAKPSTLTDVTSGEEIEKQPGKEPGK